MSLELDTAPFCYVALDRFGNALFAIYGPPPTKLQAGQLSDLLADAKMMAPNLPIRAVLWMPEYLAYPPPALLRH